MMDDRKRPFEALEGGADTPDGGAGGAGSSAGAVAQNKKLQLERNGRSRTLTPRNSVPPADEAEADESPAYKGLEEFRKEAIYRRFLEGQRDLGRAERRMLHLQRDLAAFEQRSATFQRGWEAVTDDLKSLLSISTLADERDSIVAALDASKQARDSHALQQAMQAGANAIHQIFKLLTSSGGKLSASEADLQARCLALGGEAAELRAEAKVQQATLDRVSQELQDATQRLRRAERQRDRILSPSVRSIEKLGEPKEEADTSTPKTGTPAPEQKAKKEGTPADQGPGTPSAGVNGTQQAVQLEELEQLASKRLAEVESIRSELLELRTENATLRGQVDTVAESRIAASPAYLELRKHAEEVSGELGRAKAEWEAVQLENIELRESRQAFEQLSKDQANLVVEELRKQLANKDADILRLRGQRDELQTDNAERKQKEAAKVTALEEIKALAELKERTSQKLRADVRRLQMVLAGRRADAETFQALVAAGSDGTKLTDADVDIEARLKAKLDDLEAKSKELQVRCEALEAAGQSADLAKQNAELAVQIAELEVLTKDASGQDASARLKEQEEAIKRLQSQVATSDATIAELCAEIDQVGQQAKSTADVEKEFARRVVDLSKLEERLVRLSSEKSKADNKYFAAMRAKDAEGAEKLVIQRAMERQAQVIERYAEAEKSFAAQIQLHEQEVSLLRKSLEEHKTRLADLTIQYEGARAREAEAVGLLHAANARLHAEVQSAEAARGDKARLEERVALLDKELERSKKVIASGAGGASGRKGSSGGTDDQLQMLNQLLRCSACNERYRSKIITKCLHTFCAQCIEARISTRQRKCPHCGLAFAISDVQTFFLQ